MRLIAILLFAICTAATAEEKRPQPAPAAKITIPADAERIDENTYKHVDANGETWYYRPSPFGVIKNQVPPSAPAQAGVVPMPFPDKDSKQAARSAELTELQRKLPIGIAKPERPAKAKKAKTTK